MKNTVAVDLVNFLEDCHIDAAFGVSGGFVFPLWDALFHSKKIDLFHCRYESGGVFSASEYSICNNKPSVAFATSGPGITNALTGVKAARLDGSNLLFISSITDDYHTGKYKLQETTRDEINSLRVHDGQGFFDEIYFVSNLTEYKKAKKSISENINRVSGICIGLFITSSLQKTIIDTAGHGEESEKKDEGKINNEKLQLQLNQATNAIINNKTLFWIGFGARHAAEQLKKVVELSQSHVISTPRGKGIFPETHPLYAGATGLGANQQEISAELSAERHPVVIILGSRLGELSSSYVQSSLTNSTVFFVGINSHEVAGNLPEQTTIIECEIGAFLQHVLQNIELKKNRIGLGNIHHVVPYEDTEMHQSHLGYLHPRTVMQSIQHIVINQYDGYVAAEAGNSFTWTNRYLKFYHPVRYRSSPGFGAMGQYACGLVGLSANRNNVVIGVIGDGSMLMTNEVSTAVRYHLPAIWLVMNDGCYNMCRQLLQESDVIPPDCEIPLTDFALIGEGLGAVGYRATDKESLDKALISAIKAKAPAVIDVRIDRTVLAPSTDRVKTLRSM